MTSHKVARVLLTPGCYSAVEDYARMRGLTMSQALYLAFRYNFHREALQDKEVQDLFIKHGVPFDPEIVAEWQRDIEERKGLKEVFTPIPAEAIPGAGPGMALMWRVTSLVVAVTVGLTIFSVSGSLYNGLQQQDRPVLRGLLNE